MCFSNPCDWSCGSSIASFWTFICRYQFWKKLLCSRISFLKRDIYWIVKKAQVSGRKFQRINDQGSSSPDMSLPHMREQFWLWSWRFPCPFGQRIRSNLDLSVSSLGGSRTHKLSLKVRDHSSEVSFLIQQPKFLCLEQVLSVHGP